MLSEEEKQAITALLGEPEIPRGAALEALKTVQRFRGFVSDEAIVEVAALLSMTPDELEGIATFFTFIFRKPVGRNIILLCDSVACWMLGYDHIRFHLEERLGIGLGETTTDGRFTLLPVSCIGACDRAPAVMINGKIFGDLDGDKLDEILEGYR